MRRIEKSSFIAIFGPEILFYFAICHWTSARRYVISFIELGYFELTLQYVYYCDVGGIVLNTKDFIAFHSNTVQIALAYTKRLP